MCRKNSFALAGAFFPVVLLFCGFTIMNIEEHTFFTEKMKIVYHTKNGMIDGLYDAYYLNGNKRAEGMFAHNLRTGKWTVWDSAGKKITEREYANGFEYKRIYPEVPKDGPIPLLTTPKYTLTYNKQGFIPYCYIEERVVRISKRLWRYIPKDGNPALFQNDRLYHTLVDSVINGKIKMWEASSDEFKMLLTDENRKRWADTTGKEIVGYKIKEDWYFDSDRMLSETRIIGICPVVKEKDDGTKKDSYEFDAGWLYGPQLRATLASLKAENPSIPEVHTIDDLFFFRGFKSQVIKESRYYERPVDPKSGKQFEYDTEAIELAMIETEHDYWIYYSGK